GGRERPAHRDGADEQTRPRRRHRHGQLDPDRAVRHAGARARQRAHRGDAAEPGVHAAGDRHVDARHADRGDDVGRRTGHVVQGRPAASCLLDHRGVRVLDAAAGPMSAWLAWVTQVDGAHRYAVLFYTLLLTLAAAPLLHALRFDAHGLRIFLVFSLLVALLGVP